MIESIVLGDAEIDKSATGIAEPIDVNIEAAEAAEAAEVAVTMEGVLAFHIANARMNMTADGIATITTVSEGTGKKTIKDEYHCSRPQGLENFWWPEKNVQG